MCFITSENAAVHRGDSGGGMDKLQADTAQQEFRGGELGPEGQLFVITTKWKSKTICSSLQ